MSLSEFDTISQYFNSAKLGFSRSGVSVGIGDDGAVIESPQGAPISMSMDLLVEGVHFPVKAEGRHVASRALAVNLSDLSAMTARPLCFTLGLSLPSLDNDWLEGFSEGLSSMAKRFDCPLVGGDLTRSPAGTPIVIAIQVHGYHLDNAPVLRSTAQSGDGVFVTGTLGDGAASLNMIKGHSKQINSPDRLLKRFYEPQPQVEIGIKLRNIASACIDISDGLIADLGHICQASRVCGQIETNLLPVHGELVETWPQHFLGWALTGGDDYQLGFTVPLVHRETVDQWIAKGKLQATLIGQILAANNSDDLVIVDGQSSTAFNGGFDHFSR